MSDLVLLLRPFDTCRSYLLGDEFGTELEKDIIKNFYSGVTVNQLFGFWDNLVWGDVTLRDRLVGRIHE